jgi:hypothetical protein
MWHCKANRKRCIEDPSSWILAPPAVPQKQKQIDNRPQKQELGSYPKCDPGKPAEPSLQHWGSERLGLYACLTH